MDTAARPASAGNAAKLTTRDLVYIAAFAALLAVCSWISIPTVIPFTMQTFGVFLAIGLLGGKRALLAVLVYLLLAAVGVPVLAGFTGGIGILLGSTGGYMFGFILTCLLAWALERLFGSRTVVQAAAMVLGLALCYLFGTVWYVVVCTRTEGAVSFLTALSWCVVPYLLPDAVKFALALGLSARLRRHVR